MIVYVVTHSSEEWTAVEGVFGSLQSARDSQTEEYNREENKLQWEDDYNGTFELPMNSFPIEIVISSMEVVP